MNLGVFGLRNQIILDETVYHDISLLKFGAASTNY